jgi:hypothetical protein
LIKFFIYFNKLFFQFVLIKQPKPKRVSNVDSSTLFQLKPPQINNITWKEINASWEGMFGYSNKLRLGVIKKDILGCLRDLKAMRETNSFDNILLNIWEKKFNKWLDELDNVQNVSCNNFYFLIIIFNLYLINYFYLLLFF